MVSNRDSPFALCWDRLLDQGANPQNAPSQPIPLQPPNGPFCVGPLEWKGWEFTGLVAPKWMQPGDGTRLEIHKIGKSQDGADPRVVRTGQKPPCRYWHSCPRERHRKPRSLASLKKPTVSSDQERKSKRKSLIFSKEKSHNRQAILNLGISGAGHPQNQLRIEWDLG